MDKIKSPEKLNSEKLIWLVNNLFDLYTKYNLEKSQDNNCTQIAFLNNNKDLHKLKISIRNSWIIIFWHNWLKFSIKNDWQIAFDDIDPIFKSYPEQWIRFFEDIISNKIQELEWWKNNEEEIKDKSEPEVKTKLSDNFEITEEDLCNRVYNIFHPKWNFAFIRSTYNWFDITERDLENHEEWFEISIFDKETERQKTIMLRKNSKWSLESNNIQWRAKWKNWKINLSQQEIMGLLKKFFA